MDVADKHKLGHMAPFVFRQDEIAVVASLCPTKGSENNRIRSQEHFAQSNCATIRFWLEVGCTQLDSDGNPLDLVEG